MIYVASPYSHPDPIVMQSRFESVESFTASLMKAGKYAFSPIVYGHEMAKRHTLPTDAKWWQDFNHHMLLNSRSMFILMIDGWKESKGVAMELEWASSARIPVYYYFPLGGDYMRWRETDEGEPRLI